MSLHPTLSSLPEQERTWLEAITPNRVQSSLKGFPLPFAEGWDYSRLSIAIQQVARAGLVSEAQGNAEAVKELETLAIKAKQLRLGIQRLGQTAHFHVFVEATRILTPPEREVGVNWDAAYKAVMVAPLLSAEQHIARAASQIRSGSRQPPRWREKLAQRARIDFAIELMSIFEDAFLTPARASNWYAEYGQQHPWPEFFDTIYRDLFPGHRLNLSEVLQAAAKERPKVVAMELWLEGQDATRSGNKSE